MLGLLLAAAIVDHAWTLPTAETPAAGTVSVELHEVMVGGSYAPREDVELSLFGTFLPDEIGAVVGSAKWRVAGGRRASVALMGAAYASERLGDDSDTAGYERRALGGLVASAHVGPALVTLNGMAGYLDGFVVHNGTENSSGLALDLGASVVVGGRLAGVLEVGLRSYIHGGDESTRIAQHLYAIGGAKYDAGPATFGLGVLRMDDRWLPWVSVAVRFAP